MDDKQFARLLEFLGYSWPGYRKVRKGVKKRVARHMQELGCRSLHAYLQRLAADPVAMAVCEQRMAVSISRFFRDLKVWRVLAELVLPELTELGKRQITVWFAGCACGEEVYSFRILWSELSTAGSELPAARLIATDLDPVCLKRAKRGLYPAGALRDVDVDRREKWFVYREEEEYEVLPELRDGILWLRHNALTAYPPAEELDIVFLRNNLLTYFRQEIMASPLRRIIHHLTPGGFLITGATETMPDPAAFGLLARDRCIHQKPETTF